MFRCSFSLRNNLGKRLTSLSIKKIQNTQTPTYKASSAVTPSDQTNTDGLFSLLRSGKDASSTISSTAPGVSAETKGLFGLVGVWMGLFVVYMTSDEISNSLNFRWAAHFGPCLVKNSMNSKSVQQILNFYIKEPILIASERSHAISVLESFTIRGRLPQMYLHNDDDQSSLSSQSKVLNTVLSDLVAPPSVGQGKSGDQFDGLIRILFDILHKMKVENSSTDIPLDVLERLVTTNDELWLNDPWGKEVQAVLLLKILQMFDRRRRVVQLQEDASGSSSVSDGQGGDRSPWSGHSTVGETGEGNGGSVSALTTASTTSTTRESSIISDYLSSPGSMIPYNSIFPFRKKLYSSETHNIKYECGKIIQTIPSAGSVSTPSEPVPSKRESPSLETKLQARSWELAIGTAFLYALGKKLIALESISDIDLTDLMNYTRGAILGTLLIEGIYRLEENVINQPWYCGAGQGGSGARQGGQGSGQMIGSSLGLLALHCALLKVILKTKLPLLGPFLLLRLFRDGFSDPYRSI